MEALRGGLRRLHARRRHPLWRLLYRAAGSSPPLPRVDFWGIWNEPNYGQDLAPQAIGSSVELSPNLYRGLLDAGYTSLKATGHGERHHPDR